MHYKKPLRICLEGRDPVVRELTRPIPPTDITGPGMQAYYDDLIAAMLQYEGIGIAANQVGQAWQVFVVHGDYAPQGQHLVVINPRLVSESGRTHAMEEGCLSVPGVYGPVERPSKIRIKGVGRDGGTLDIKAKGMFARILQHEYDHLQATVFIDRATHLAERPRAV